MNALSREFYEKDTVKVARKLLGKTLVRRIGNDIISGIITETEAYRFDDDPASHAFGKITERNRAMFGEVGRAYVYFTYGMYYCVNAVARSKNFEAGAVLIRALNSTDKVVTAMIMVEDTVSSVTSQTEFVLTLTFLSYPDNAFNGAIVVFTDAVNAGEKSFRRCTDFAAGTKLLTIDSAPDFTIAATDAVTIIPDLGAILDLLPAALVGGRMDSDVEAVRGDVLTGDGSDGDPWNPTL